MRSASAARCTGAAPRWPLSSGAALTPSMRSVTSTSVSGGMRWATSPSSSVGGPAIREADDGPEERVLARAETQETPGTAIRCTTKRSAANGASRWVSDVVGVADRLGVDEVAADPDEARLVADDGRRGLEDDGIRQLPRGGDRGVDSGDRDRRPDAYAVGTEQLARLLARERAPLRAPREVAAR